MEIFRRSSDAASTVWLTISSNALTMLDSVSNCSRSRVSRQRYSRGVHLGCFRSILADDEKLASTLRVW